VPAYAATIHKSQGSEYPAVVIPVMTQHYAMLQRNLLYTGVTRGKRLVVLVGQKKAARGIDRSIRAVRLSRLNEGFKLPNFCSRDPAECFGPARIFPPFEIAIALSRRATRAFRPTVHSAPVPTPHSRLPTRMTGAASIARRGRGARSSAPGENALLAKFRHCAAPRNSLFR
jgi:hypothetical protein